MERTQGYSGTLIGIERKMERTQGYSGTLIGIERWREHKDTVVHS